MNRDGWSPLCSRVGRYRGRMQRQGHFDQGATRATTLERTAKLSSPEHQRGWRETVLLAERLECLLASLIHPHPTRTLLGAVTLVGPSGLARYRRRVRAVRVI